jgi:N utilization substance protein B
MAGAGPRRRAREAALQALYQIDLNPGLLPEQALTNVFAALVSEEETPVETDLGELRSFAQRLVGGVRAQHAAIDERIVKTSSNWRLERMAAVDRNLLRMAVHELLYENDIPAAATLDEAAEIAKRYGTADSAAFVSGVLHKIVKELGKK